MPTIPRAAARRPDGHCRLRIADGMLQWAIRNSRFAICLLLLFLASCHVPGSVRPTLKIGLVAPFEGRYRYIGYDLFAAVRLALHEANEAGGVGGYSVELVAYDDGGDPQMASQQARKMALDPQVVVAIGHFREATTEAALPVYAEAGLPLLVPGVLAAGDGTAEGSVAWLGPRADALAEALLAGVDTVTLVEGDGSLDEALQRRAAQMGVRVAWSLSPDNLGGVAHVSDVVVCAADPVSCGEVVAELAAAGWQGEFRGGPELAASDFAAVAGGAAEGVLFVTPWALPDDAGLGEWISAYNRIAGGNGPGPLALPAYEAARAALQALATDAATHGMPTREGVAAVLGAPSPESPLTLSWYRIAENGVPERCEPQTGAIH